MAESRSRRLARRAFRFVLKALLVGAGLVVVALVGTLVYLNTGAGRTALARWLETFLSKTLTGDVRISSIGRVSPWRVTGLEGVVRMDGIDVLEVAGAAATVDLPTLLRSLPSQGPIRVHLSEVSVDTATVVIDLPGGKEPAIARAFRPSAPGSGGRDVVVRIDSARAGWARVEVRTKDLLVVTASDALATVDVAGNGEPVTVRLTHARVSGGIAGAPVEVEGVARGLLVAPTSKDAEVVINAQLLGSANDVPFVADARLEGQELSAEVSADADGEALASLHAPLAKAQVPVHVDAQVGGQLPTLTYAATAQANKGEPDTLSAWGEVHLGPSLDLTGGAQASSIDASHYAPNAPATDLSATAAYCISQSEDGELSIHVTLEAPPGEVAGERTPELHATARLIGESLTGEVSVEHPGVSAYAKVTSHALGFEQPTLHVSFGVSSDELANVQELPAVRGSVTATGEGRLDLDRLRWVGRARIAADDLEYGPVGVSHALAVVHLRGTAAKPEHVDANATLRGVELPSATLGSVKLSIQGQALSPRVAAQLSGNHEQVALRIGKLDFSDGFRVGGLRLSGAGRVEGSLAVRGQALEATVTGEAVELGILARLFGHPELIDSGQATFAARVRRQGAEWSGIASGRLTEVRRSGIEQADGVVTGLLNEGRLTAVLKGRVEPFGEVTILARSLEFPRRFELGPETRLPHGAVQVVGSARAEDLAELLGDESSLALSSGRLTAHLAYRHEDGADCPEILLQLAGIDLGGWLEQGAPTRDGDRPSHDADADGPRAPILVDDVDVWLSARLLPQGREVSLRSKVDYRGQELATVTADAIVPLPELLARPENALQIVRDQPFAITIRMPSQDLTRLPAGLPVEAFEGLVDATLQAAGTPAHPHFNVRMNAQQVRPIQDGSDGSSRGADGKPRPRPAIHASVVMRNDGNDVALAGAVRHGRRGAAHVLATGYLPNLVICDPEKWRASVEAKLADLQLRHLPSARFHDVRGVASGTVSVSDLNLDPRARARLRVERLRSGSIELGTADLELDLGNDSAKARLAVRNAKSHLKVAAGSNLLWKDQLVPALPADGIVEGEIVARSFDLAAVQPLLPSGISEAGGRLDGKLALDWKGGDSKHPEVEGRITIRDGAVHIDALGQDLRDIHGKLEATRDGRIRLEQMSARGITGRVEVDGAAKLAGGGLESIELNFDIDEDESFRVTLQGVPYGQLHGNAKARIEPTEAGMQATIDASNLELELPESLGRKVQTLDDPEYIVVGARRNGELVELPLRTPAKKSPSSPVVWHVVTSFERVEITRDQAVRVVLSGGPTVRLANEARLSGQLTLEGGHLEVVGKRFEIESGTITFNGETPPNPTVGALARWSAPAGYDVYAEYTGPAVGGKLSLRSSPPLSEGQILGLIALGTPDTTLSAGDPAGGSGAAVGGGIAATGLNEAISDFTNLEVSANVETSDSQARPEVAVQLTPRVRAEIGYDLAEPTPGKNPDRSTLTLEFRVTPHWNLITTVGDRGSSIVDLVWRFRY